MSRKDRHYTLLEKNAPEYSDWESTPHHPMEAQSDDNGYKPIRERQVVQKRGKTSRTTSSTGRCKVGRNLERRLSASFLHALIKL